MVRDLTANDYEAREAASENLRALGAAVRPKLRTLRMTALDVELQCRLDGLLHGPMIDEKSLAKWIEQLDSEDHEEIGEAISVLQKAGKNVRLQLAALLEHKEPLERSIGLWLTARLGADAHGARPSLKKLLKDALAQFKLDAACDVNPSETWILYIQPQEVRADLPPWASFYFGDRDQDAYTGLDEAYDRLRSAPASLPGDCVVRCYEAPRPAAMRSLLWGTVYTLQCARSCSVTSLTLSDRLQLRLASWTLEQVGVDAESNALLAQAKAQLAKPRK